MPRRERNGGPLAGIEGRWLLRTEAETPRLPRCGSRLGFGVRWAQLFGALLMAGVLSHGVGYAQVSGGDESASNAAALFDRGRTAAAGHDWLLAFSLFERSFRLLPSYDTAANLGQAALKLDRYADAADFLMYSMEHFPPSGDAERHDSIQSLLEIALAEVGVVQISCEPPDAELFLDGERVKTINPNRWYLSPGRHIISAEAAGYKKAAREIAVRARTNNHLSLQLSPIQPGHVGEARPKPLARPAADWRDPIPIVLVGGGLTVASLGVGIGFQLLADSKESQAEEAQDELDGGAPTACSGSERPGVCSRINTLATEADDRRRLSYVGYGVASAALVATATLLLWPRSREQSSFVPTLVVDGKSLGLTAEGRF